MTSNEFKTERYQRKQNIIKKNRILNLKKKKKGKDCNKHYIGETQRNFKKRIYEHKRSIKINDDRNAFFSHTLELKHTFNFSKPP